MEKLCTGCNKIKDISEFYKKKKYKFGVYYLCKKCSYIQCTPSRIRYHKSEKFKQYVKEHYSRYNSIHQS